MHSLDDSLWEKLKKGDAEQEGDAQQEGDICTDARE